MRRPPPRSTLFPYTTLFRSLTEPPRPIRGLRPAVTHHLEAAVLRGLEKLSADRWRSAQEFAQALARSEEHTSELQSLAYLVCRLLLEKKNRSRSRYRFSSF